MTVTLTKRRQSLPHHARTRPVRRARRHRLGRAHHHRRRTSTWTLGIVRPGRQVNNDQDFVFFNNLISSDGSVRRAAGNLTGEGDGDDETITVDMNAVPPAVDKIAFPVSIYDASARRPPFGQVCNAFIRVIDAADNTEIARYDRR